MTEYSDKASKTNKSRNKLYALEQNHREAGRFTISLINSNNQFVVRSDKFRIDTVDGKLVMVIHIAPKYGKPIRLTTTTNGKNVDLSSKNWLSTWECPCLKCLRIWRWRNGSVVQSPCRKSV